MQSDRLVKIYVGTETPESKPFLVQQSTLEHTTDYFRKAFRNEHLGTTEPGTLRFPEDDLNAWNVFLYWVVRRKLPPTEELMPALTNDDPDLNTDHSLVVHCWALGDKYDIPTFQDEVMLELLRSQDSKCMELSAVKLAFEHTPPGAKLRELMAEEVGGRLAHGEIEYEQLDMFDGIVGFTSVLARKAKELQDLEVWFSSLQKTPGYDDDREEWVNSDKWRSYMVGEGPQQHWVHRGDPNAEDKAKS